MHVFQRPVCAAGHADDATMVEGHCVVDDPGLLRTGNVDPPTAVGVDQIVGDDSAALVDLEEDPRAVVVMGDVAHDPDVGVVAVEPDAVGIDVVRNLAVADGASHVAGNALHAAGMPAGMKSPVVIGQQGAVARPGSLRTAPMPRPVLPL